MSGPPPPHAAPVPSGGTEKGPGSRRWYREYRRRQGFRLLTLVPEGGVRSLYRQARAWSGEEGEVVDPLALLMDYCQEIMPLPPFEVWELDRAAHPAAHLDEAPPSPAPEAPSEPVTVELRDFEERGSAWTAALNVHPDGDRWRGHIAFHSGPAADRTHATGEIFSEPAARTVRDRFLALDDHTLRAFLRSALP